MTGATYEEDKRILEKGTLMTFIIVLVATVAACFALRNPLHKWPVAFYVLAVAVDVVFAFGTFGMLPRSIWMPMLVLVQKCMVALALFVVVMFIGCFSKESKVGRWLRPVRAELSIIACILACGHMAVYLASYLPRLAMGGLGGNVLASLTLALVLLALLLVLGITSFQAVKKHMRTETWKRVQKFAYLFFGLVYVHLVLMLLPSALAGGAAAQTTVGIYTVAFGGYAVARIARALADRRAVAAEGASAAAAVAFDEEAPVSA